MEKETGAERGAGTLGSCLAGLGHTPGCVLLRVHHVVIRHSCFPYKAEAVFLTCTNCDINLQDGVPQACLNS